jgi:ribosomal-protein-alanine N-acetyltransferase
MDPQAVFTPFPTLHTPRLVLRALRMDDLDDLYEYASDPELARYTPWDHYRSLEEAHADLVAYVAQYESETMGVRGMGNWGIEHRADGKLIGICNFTYWRTRHRRAEIGYAISRRYWGQGLAVEAAQAVINFSWERMNLLRIEATCLVENMPSQHVMQKLGMKREGVLRSYEIWRNQPQDLVMHALVRAE